MKRRAWLVTVLAALVVLAAMTPALAGGSNQGLALEVRPPDSDLGRCLKLTWKVDEPSRVGEYRIMRSTDPSGGFEQVFAGEVDMDSGGRMDFVDSALREDRTYYYQVVLVGKDGEELARTNVGSGTTEAADRGADYGGKWIIISVYDQTIYFMNGDDLVKSHLCSTGVDSHPTPFGAFEVEYHEYLVVSERYGGAYCYWWMGFYPDTGMHALPYDPDTGSYYGWSYLGQKASHGCVRQAPSDAEWAYKWAPNGTPIHVINYHFDPNPEPEPEPEPPPPPPPPITGGHSSQGISELSGEWYFAEGCTFGQFDEYILVMNPGGTDALVTADFMRPDGSVVNKNYVVPALSRYTVHVDEVSGLENTEVSARLVSDQLIAAERSMYFEYNGILGGTDSAGATSPCSEWFLAEGYTGGSFDEYVLIQNPGEMDGTVWVDYMRSDGENFTQEFPIKAHSRMTIHVDEIGGLTDAEVSTRVVSDKPVVVERSQYFDYYGRPGGNACVGVNCPAIEWYLAEGYTGGLFDEYVLIMNPNDWAGVADVTFMCQDGRNLQQRYELMPKSRFSIDVGNVAGIGEIGVSTLVESSVGVVVERSMYFDSEGRLGGADAPGVIKPAIFWCLPEGYTSGSYDTYVLVMNPNDQEVTVDVSFLLANGGGVVQKSYQVGAAGRGTIHVDSIPELSDAAFSTTVYCPQPIICERSMYFSIPRE